jgi:hypothetical protein
LPTRCPFISLTVEAIGLIGRRMGPEFVVLNAVLLGAFGKHDSVVDLVDKEPLILQRAETAFASPVLPERLDPGADMVQLALPRQTSNLNERSGPPLSVTIVTAGLISPASGST